MKPSIRIVLLFVIIIVLIMVWWLATRPRPPEVVSCNNNNLLPPEACNPNWLTAVNFAIAKTLAELPASACQSTLLPPGVGQCTVRTYTDVNNQKFTITVEGADTQVVQNYLNTTKPYFIAQQAETGVTPPQDQNLPSLSRILVDAVVSITGFSQKDLSVKRANLIKQHDGNEKLVTLEEVIKSIAPSDPPVDPEQYLDQVREAAIENAISEFTAADTAAGLTQEEIDKLREEINALITEPGAMFLYDPATTPQDDAGYRAMLMEYLKALVITLDWASAPRKESANLWAVWFGFDPELAPWSISHGQTPIGSYTYNYYQTKCNVYSASTQIYAVQGSMTNYFWRSYPYSYIGATIANVQGYPLSGWLSDSAYSTLVSYDTSVIGGSNGGSYYIYGGWVQGWGCQY